MIKVQQTAEALAADNRARHDFEVIGGFNDLIVQALMIAFPVIMASAWNIHHETDEPRERNIVRQFGSRTIRSLFQVGFSHAMRIINNKCQGLIASFIASPRLGSLLS